MQFRFLRGLCCIKAKNSSWSQWITSRVGALLSKCPCSRVDRNVLYWRCSENCQLAFKWILATKWRFLAVNVLMIPDLIHGLIYYGLDKLIPEQNVFKLLITYPDFCQMIYVLSFCSLHAVFINGRWKEYQKLELEIRILYKTSKICSKFSLVYKNLCKESNYYSSERISHVLSCRFVFRFLSQEFAVLHLSKQEFAFLCSQCSYYLCLLVVCFFLRKKMCFCFFYLRAL